MEGALARPRPSGAEHPQLPAMHRLGGLHQAVPGGGRGVGQWERCGAMPATLLPRAGMGTGHLSHLLEAALGDRDPGFDGDDGVGMAGGEDLLPQRGDALQLQLLALQGLHQLLGGHGPWYCQGSALQAPPHPLPQRDWWIGVGVPKSPHLRALGAPNPVLLVWRDSTSPISLWWHPTSRVLLWGSHSPAGAGWGRLTPVLGVLGQSWSQPEAGAGGGWDPPAAGSGTPAQPPPPRGRLRT